MKQYMVSVHHRADDPQPSPEEVQRIYADVDAFNQDVVARGQLVFGGGLHPRETATVVSCVDGQVTTTDGPFIEAKEWLGGFWVLKAADLDEALELGARASAACHAPVEVRPFQEEPEG